MRRYYKAPSGSSKIGFLTVGSTLANRERGAEICQRFKATVQAEKANFLNWLNWTNMTGFTEAPSVPRHSMSTFLFFCEGEQYVYILYHGWNWRIWVVFLWITLEFCPLSSCVSERTLEQKFIHCVTVNLFNNSYLCMYMFVIWLYIVVFLLSWLKVLPCHFWIGKCCPSLISAYNVFTKTRCYDKTTFKNQGWQKKQ